MHANPLEVDKIAQEDTATVEFKAAQKAYSSFLSQKAKATWLVEGDQNTAIFLKALKQRQQQKRTYTIRDVEGNWVDSPQKVPEAFLEFYNKLLGEQMINRSPVNKAVI